MAVKWPAMRIAEATEPGGRESFVRYLDRHALFVALERAVMSDSGPSVLVVFGFEGLKQHLEEVSDADGDALLARLADRLTVAVGSASSIYQPRRGEFCALFDGRLQAVKPLLVTAPAELDEEARAFSIRSSIGIAVLPDEATVPTYALALADHRLRALSGDLRPVRPAQGG